MGWLVCSGLLVSVPTSGQFVDGEWVQRGEANIRKYRMTNVSFLVLDADGKLAADAEIRLEQEAHAFGLGWAVHETFPSTYNADDELWRVFNHISLEPLTSWRAVQPETGGPLQTDRLLPVVQAAQDAGLAVHWGSLLSAEPFDLPEWVVPLRGQALYLAALGYAYQVEQTFGSQLSSIAICGELENNTDPRFSPAMLRLIDANLTALRPHLDQRLRYDDAWQGDRTASTLETMEIAANEQLARDGFSVEARFPPRPVRQDQIEPALRRIAKLGRPFNLSHLEVAGAHGIETTVNLETIIRTLFAEPMVSGITFAGLSPNEFTDGSAALVDAQGQPTGAGLALDRLFRDVWWSQETIRTDELGRAQSRVFLGDYTVTATLADGSIVSMPLLLRKRDDSPEPIILMPVKTGG